MNTSQQIHKNNEEWRKKLTPEQYDVLRCSATEPPFTGIYVNTKDPGMYRCAACENPLFSSETKFDSGSGWPSFFAAASPESITTKSDMSLGVERTEVLCARCGSHLGHVFDDGPQPSGQRFCINSIALTLEHKKS